MDLRLIWAIFLGKITAKITKFKGGGATAAPGLYALKADPNLIKKLTRNLKHGSIVISGTNGKTTTSRLISDILASKYQVIHNRQGSNLLRGIASTLISKSSFTGKITKDLGIWEVDEAALPETIDAIKPRIVILLNLFRDQLDRYGEVDSIRSKWQEALARLPKDATLIANADDPGISFITGNFKNKVIFFGINDQKVNLPEVFHVADIRFCPNCSAKLSYQALLSGHMGHFSCPKCNFKRPKPSVSASNLKFNPDFSASLNLTVNSSQFTVGYQLPGLYNAYNILAAVSVSNYLKIGSNEIKAKISKFTAAFGRFQKINYQKRRITIFLIKNPTGANEVLRVLALKDKINLLIVLNDNFADSRDVSWIWDTNWEVLSGRVKTILVSGIRAWDMATRLKYAGFKMSKNMINTNINYSLNFTVKTLKSDEQLIILPTYTAMLEIQKIISKSGETKWHED